MTDKKTKSPEPKEPRRVLGRGLDALLPIAQVAQAAAKRADSPYQIVAIERVHPRKDQPRKRFEEQALQELSASIAEQGIIQPLVVRRLDDDPTQYEIIAGERRWRASQRAGLREVPVVLRETTADEAFELALVENLQRQDLDAIETAEAYQKLIREHHWTQDALAERIGKDRSTISNTLRLLQLPGEVVSLLTEQKISEGHARALLSAHSPAEVVRLAKLAVDKGWSVRQTEQATRRKEKTSEKPAAEKSKDDAPRGPNILDLEKRLSGALGMPVAVRPDASNQRGTVEIAWDNLDQLDRLIDKILESEKS
jgi:ParB family transcriptional regulator, chromosome partitioning protein